MTVASQLAIGAGSAVVGALAIRALSDGGAGGGGGLGPPGVLTQFLPSQASQRARVVVAGATSDRTPEKSANVKGDEQGGSQGGETGGLEPLGTTKLEDFTGRESEVTVFRDPSGEVVVPGYDVDVGEGTVRAVSPSSVERDLGIDQVSGQPSGGGSVDSSPSGAGDADSFDADSLVDAGADLRRL